MKKTIEKLRDHSEYSAEVAKHNRFSAKLAALDAERTAINAITSAQQTSHDDPVAAAEAMLDGTKAAQENHSARLGEIIREESLLRQALASQRETLDAIAARLSRDVCAKFDTEHQAAARRILAALEELDAALGVADDLRNGIERAGYSAAALPDLAWPLIGRIDDSTGSMAFYKRKELRHIIND
jgi:hypothetical protein